MTENGLKIYDYFFDCVQTDNNCEECKELLKHLGPDEAYPSEICGECFNHCGDEYRP